MSLKLLSLTFEIKQHIKHVFTHSHVVFVFLKIFICQLSEADLEGACGSCAPPPHKIRKAYVIQR